jgi:hypothetical protein
MRQGPPRFIGCGIRVLGGVEVQPGALGVLFQQALALEAAADALADGDDLGLTLQTNFVTKALVGLFGSDSFRLAVSADGSTFFDGLTVDNTNGIVDQPQLPRFKAWSNYDNYVGVGAWTKIGLNNTDTNDQGAFPDHKTIAEFRRTNGPAIRKTCAQFVELCRRVGVLKGDCVAIDGSKFKAVNNRDKNFTKGKIASRA